MNYISIDELQHLLARKVFHYAKDAKKAAGRALGTLVEVVTFYLLKSWGFETSLSIERSLPEYGNPDITHNVEYTLHPILGQHEVVLGQGDLPFTAGKILSAMGTACPSSQSHQVLNTTLLTKNGILRNACAVASTASTYLMAFLSGRTRTAFRIALAEQHARPYAMFECKRVGVEEGMRKGPQTIEKAKQGAYVAKAVSSLHKLRTASGELHGLVYRPNHTLYSKLYSELISEIVASTEPEMLKGFVLTVGVVSNHGNWFTSDNHNKELKVLAQSYDWLLFLTDKGLSEFISELLIKPTAFLAPAMRAFLASYTATKKKNQFTKVQMNLDADRVLQDYFRSNRARIETWFNVISPTGGRIPHLHLQMKALRDKDWHRVHSI